MTAKERLQQVRKIDAWIQSKESIRTGLIAQATRMSAPIEGMPKGSGGQDRICEVVAKIVDLSNEINAEIDRLVDLKAGLMRQIGRMPDGDMKNILERRYLSGERWETIASAMYIDVRHVHRLHGQALRDFEKMS